MKRRTFFKYIFGFTAIPFLGETKEKPPDLFLDICVGYKGREYAGRLDLSKSIKENGKMDYKKFDHYSKALIDSTRRKMQKEGAVECYRDDNGKELIPC